jgi:chaperonin GroEL (HSP60 family)
VEGSIVVGRLTDKDEPNFGYEAQSGEYKDMVAAGIINPTKVVRVALQDPASVAGLLITTEAMIADRPEPKGARVWCCAQSPTIGRSTARWRPLVRCQLLGVSS